MELKPGEFVSASGKTIRATCISASREDPLFNAPLTYLFSPTSPDFPAALTALQALWEEEQNPWHYIDQWHRIRRDGTNPEYWGAPIVDEWRTQGDTLWVLAYRAGLERGKG